MGAELFLTHKDLLLVWMRQKGYFSSVDLAEYALRNYYLRSARSARAMAESGIIRRIPDDEAMFRGLNKSGKRRIAWYEYKR